MSDVTKDLSSDAYALANRIIKIKMRMLSEHPFFGLLAQHVKLCIDSNVKTACTDGEKIYFGQEFSKSIGNEELYFVFFHELLHIVYKHCFRSNGLNNFIYNIAADIVINSVILDELKQLEIFINGSPLMHRTPKGEEGRKYTAEEVYAMLVDELDKDGSLSTLIVANGGSDEEDNPFCTKAKGKSQGGTERITKSSSGSSFEKWKEEEKSDSNDGSNNSPSNKKASKEDGDLRDNTATSGSKFESSQSREKGNSNGNSKGNDSNDSQSFDNNGVNGNKSNDKNGCIHNNNGSSAFSNTQSGEKDDLNGNSKGNGTKDIQSFDNNGGNGDKSEDKNSSSPNGEGEGDDAFVEGISDDFFFDDHSKWGESESNELNKAKWQQRVYDAVQVLKDTKGFGSVPALAQRMVDEIQNPPIDWRSVLINFIQSDVYDYSFSPPDRRYSESDFFLPDFNEKADKVENVWIVVDSSGSVSDKQLALALNEIKGAIEQYNGRFSGWVSFFDYYVTKPEAFDSLEDIKRLNLLGGGGTSFENIFKARRDYFDEDLSCIIIITDGYAPWPKESEADGIPVLWLFNNLKVTPPWGMVARMNIKERN